MSYPAVLPTILDAIGGRPPGTTVLARELAELTGRNFSQIRSAIAHANATGRVVMIERAGEETAWVWNGLGPNAKKVDRIRVDTAQLKDAGQPAQPIHRGKTPEEYGLPASDLQVRAAVVQNLYSGTKGSALFESVRLLKDGAVLLEDEDGSLWVARRLDAR